MNDYQIRELINKALQGMIDKNDLTGTEKAHVLHYAERAKIKELQFIHELVLFNPDKTFDELAGISETYKDCLKIINWLSQEPEQMLSGTSSQPEPVPPTEFTFPDYIIPSPSGTSEERRAEVMALAEKIRDVLIGEKGKAAAAVFWVLHEAGKISITQPTPAYNAMKEYFGEIGVPSGFTRWFGYNNTGLTCSIEIGYIQNTSRMIFK